MFTGFFGSTVPVNGQNICREGSCIGFSVFAFCTLSATPLALRRRHGRKFFSVGVGACMIEMVWTIPGGLTCGQENLYQVARNVFKLGRD